ncbi:epoxide hydrolase [Streptomyces sp. RFCAC02]|uniref:epoxide hydrolase family protein n=1 Tax=Streptomyces sp. RFCAC02 TaxID=2499143 RepID=UPI00101EF4D9|nr:epoxide hydrolase [Streptomyces sp. RFCAC02]
MTENSEIRTFRIDIPDSALTDLRERLERTRWTDPAPDSAYGVRLDDVQRLTEHWRSAFDWRGQEARINAYPQFTTTIDGQNIHFLHVRSPEADAMPLILTHGWPGSVVEFLDVIGPLTDPAAHGGDPGDAFHLVIPSLPGFGFSGPTTDAGWGTERTAAAWAELMTRLGYGRYGAHGNDAGSMISPRLAGHAQDRVVGAHVTQVFSFPSGDPAEFAGMSEQDMAQMQQLQWFLDSKFSFNQLHSQQPQTLAHALADSPAGLLGWMLQLMDDEAMGGRRLDDDFVITNAAIHWLTNTAGSSIRFYYEDANSAPAPAEPSTFPLGLAGFAGDFSGVRRFAERDHKNITQWHVHDAPGGHYAAHLEPELLTSDIRGFFRPLR